MGRISLSTLTETPATWQGEVWKFSTQEYLVVNDFEDYYNFSPDQVFEAWVDVIGYSAEEPPTGKQVS